MKAVLPAMARAMLGGRLHDLDVAWFASTEEAFAAAPEAEIGWLDMFDKVKMADAIARAEKLKWLTSIYAGLDGFPLDLLAERGVTLTNGKGINAIPVAEYAVMGMLAAAKRTDRIVRAHDKREWLGDAPGKLELYGSKALIIGYGAIGRRIAQMLSGFEVEVTAVRRAPAGEPNVVGPDDWRPRLGEFDWVILAAPATDETDRMLGAAEFKAMKDSAWLVNIARGSLVDQAALRSALNWGSIAGAFLDTVDPEPLPPEDPLWTAPNALITMHLSGRAQTRMFERAVALFLDNLARYRAGQPLRNVVDLKLGY